MSSLFVSKKSAALAANGGADGTANITSNKKWLPGCRVWLCADTEPELECMIVEQVGTDSVILRRMDSVAKHGIGSDISAYTTVKNARLALPGQVVRVESPFEPRERA